MSKRKVPAPITLLISDDEDEITQPRQDFTKNRSTKSAAGGSSVSMSKRRRGDLSDDESPEKNSEQPTGSVKLSVKRMSDCFRRVHEDTFGKPARNELSVSSMLCLRYFASIIYYYYYY